MLLTLTLDPALDSVQTANDAIDLIRTAFKITGYGGSVPPGPEPGVIPGVPTVAPNDLKTDAADLDASTLGFGGGTVAATGSTPPPPADTSATPSPSGEFDPSKITVDSSGLPWDNRIHATSADGTHAQNKDGKWKAKRGVQSDVVERVEAELRQIMKIPAPAANTSAPASPPAAVPAPPGATPPPPPAAAPVRVMLPAAGGASYDDMIAAGWTDATLIEHGMMAAPPAASAVPAPPGATPAPPASIPTPPAATTPQTFSQLVTWLTPHMASNVIPLAKVTEVMAELGLVDAQGVGQLGLLSARSDLVASAYEKFAPLVPAAA